MIPFACSHCGVKYRVKQELAGRAGKCPSCKQPIVVPYPVRAAAAPTGEVSGPGSSLRRAGLDVTISLQGAGKGAAETSTAAHLLAGQSRPASRYVIEKEIARGGMGAVVRAVDCDIRREVAIKYMLDQSDAGQKARFVEEAQITGQLEHPNIVPIHELGLDADQRLFFAMKMVRGRSLAQILEGLRTSPEKEERDWPLSRLLNVLVNICNAVAYAHARNVIHRDLKPANIMVGDFGEVYVMDWGLAKVVRPAESAADQSKENSRGSLREPTLDRGASHDDSGGGARTQGILTSRELEGELTQDGAIVGTPSYMPPEQARGETQALDARSDIYSIGAMLYEVLTLLPPVEREGGHVAILIRVVEGQIQPPAQRTPLRAKQGRIPKELAAIALKALSLNPADRYPSCEALRRDIERYQEGRSVSAKQDTALELIQKLIKRNKAASLSVAAATLILLTFATVFLKLNRDARLVAEEHQRSAEREKRVATEQKQRAETAQTETQKAYAEFLREQNAKELVIRQSVPAMVRAGRQQANEGRVPEAQQHVALAIAYAPDDPDTRLLKAQLLLSERRFKECRDELKIVLQHRPDDEPARLLLAQLGESESPDSVRQFALAELLKQQQVTGLAIPLLATVKTEADKKKPLVELYQKQIEANWPGLGGALKLQPNGRITLSFRGLGQISDLAPLRGMQLEELNIEGCHLLRDLSPLRGMPLKLLLASYCTGIEDISPLSGMPLENFGLYGSRNVKSFEVLKGMPLSGLTVSGCVHFNSAELLRGMPLIYLDMNGTQVTSLEPLVGMKLETLHLSGCKFVGDLSPLKGMPLQILNIDNSKVADFSPLAGAPLRSLRANHTRVPDLEPLRGMPLQELEIGDVESGDIEPLRGMPLRRFRIWSGHVHNLSALDGMELQSIEFVPFVITQGMDVLRNMKSLTRIGRITPAQKITYAPDEFWRRYDAGEFKD